MAKKEYSENATACTIVLGPTGRRRSHNCGPDKKLKVNLDNVFVKKVLEFATAPRVIERKLSKKSKKNLKSWPNEM